MEQAASIPLSERFNWRILVFAAAIAVIVGFPTYWLVDSIVTGGIKDRGEYKEVDLKAMSDWDFDQVRGTIDDVPARWRALDGQRVLLTGEMWAPNSYGGRLRSFELVYSISKCCFSGPPQIQHFVEARLPEGKAVPHYSGLVKVLGTLHVNVEREDGKVVRVYKMDVERVDPV